MSRSSGTLRSAIQLCAISASEYTIAVPSSSSPAAAARSIAAHSSTCVSISPRTLRTLISGGASGYVGAYTTCTHTDTWLLSPPVSGTSVSSKDAPPPSSSRTKSSA